MKTLTTKIFYTEYEKLIKTNSRSIKTLSTYKYILKNLSDWKTTDELLDQINFLLDSDNVNRNSLLQKELYF